MVLTKPRTRNSSRIKQPATQYVVLIGDMVASRNLRKGSRRSLQQHFLAVLDELNRWGREGLVADFTITLGDEFEGVLRPESASDMVPEVIWKLEKELAAISMRFGIGMGEIDTEIVRNPLTMDGPAFHAARKAIERAAAEDLMGGVFLGFGSGHNLILNGMARLLHHHRSAWTPQQRRVANLLHEGKRQQEVAEALNVSKQAVSAYARAGGWAAYEEGETAWRTALAEAVSSVRETA
jgi:hypothetical protein